MKKLGIMCLVVALFSLCVVPVQGKVGGIGYVGYYKPGFGEINDRFKGGMTYGIGMSFDVNPRIGLRLEYSNFTSKTEDSYTDSYTSGGTVYTEKHTMSMEVKVTPLILLAIYRFSPQGFVTPYVGAGVGIFSSKLEAKSSYKEYEDGTLVFSEEISRFWSDSPFGFTILGGIEKSVSESLTLRGEVRYLSATATFTEEGEVSDCDWSGFVGSVGMEYKF